MNGIAARWRMLLASVAIVLITAYLKAQADRIVGSVLSETGEAIAAARVTAQNSKFAPGGKTVSTDRNGAFALSGLKPGVWSVTVSADGYGVFQQIVDLTNGTAPQLSVRLSNQRLPAAITATSDLPRPRGIQPLTLETLEEAKAASLAQYMIFNPVLISTRVPVAQRHEQRTDDSVLAAVQRAPFALQILTPFARVAWSIQEAKRKYAEPALPSLDDLNRELVIVHVSEGVSFATIDTVENVVLKRDGAIQRPLKSTITPTVVQNGAGATKATATGDFVFDFSSFEPNADLTIVVIGASSNFEWTMSPWELAALR